MKYLIIFFLLSLSACNKNQGPTSCTKGILNVWTYVGSANAIFDLADLDYGINQYEINAGIGTCQMTMAISGDLCTGDIIVADSELKPGSGSDPGCSLFNGSSSYAIGADNIAILCDKDSGSCESYR